MSLNINRNIDLIIYRADGLMGSLVCEYLSNNYLNNLTWAIAEKDRFRLEELKKKLKLKK